MPRSHALALAVAVMAVVSVPAGGFAAPGSSGTGSAPVNTNPTLGRATIPQRVTPESMRIAGVVRDASGQPLGNVHIKLFSNGVSLQSTTSDPDGTFSISANPMSGANHTSDLWFESPDREAYLDQNVVLSLGSSAQEYRLFPECTPVVDLRRSAASLEITLLSPDEKKAAVRESKCLESGTAN